jgi:uncharacterized protein YkwD
MKICLYPLSVICEQTMMKKLLVATLIPFLLGSCISITRYPDASVVQQDFMTATLAPTAVNWIPATATNTASAQTANPMATASASANCTNAAVLLRDVTIPDNTQVQAGESFTKTWEFQNTGTCPWSDYTLKYTSGDDIDAPPVTSMPAAAPNQKVQVSMELTAPPADGTYSGYFALYNADGKVIPIGTEKTFWVKFRVGDYMAVAAASGSVPAPSGNCSYGPNVNYVSQVISLINAERIDAGLPALAADPEITAFAQVHAEDMAYNNFLSHDGSDGSFGERMMHHDIAHPNARIFGEILAIGAPRDAINQWRMDEHWDYVLGSGFTRIGAGYAYNSCSDYGGYFTVDFGE